MTTAVNTTSNRIDIGSYQFYTQREEDTDTTKKPTKPN